MEIRPHRIIKRKVTKKIKVGNLSVGGDAPISVQSMTNTLTTDIVGTINQIHSLEEAGADIVRVSCPDQDSTKALKNIVKEVSDTMERIANKPKSATYITFTEIPRNSWAKSAELLE